MSIGKGMKIVFEPSPCHTRGHVLYYLEEGNSRVVFTGDTLFLGGSGFFMEGSALEMAKNFDWLRKLPDDTLVYDGHEYTEFSVRWSGGIDV